jgi:urease subunit gamma/beta
VPDRGTQTSDGDAVRLTPQERDRLLIATAAQVARRRLARGVLLNIPEATAMIADEAIEAARDGLRLEQAVAQARALLGPGDVLPGVAEVVTQVRVEAVFDDGTRLVVIEDPIGGTDDPSLAPGAVIPGAVIPGAVMLNESGNVTHQATEIGVLNTASVPISVTSHWHFFEANPRLQFDRAAAYGQRLDIAAGAAIRFDPGELVPVRLVPFGGLRVAVGFAGLVDGPLDDPEMKAQALARAREWGYLDDASVDHPVALTTDASAHRVGED